MAKTISNLLVGIGFDLDKKSTDKVGSGIDSIKSKALKLGSIVAGAFGIKALTSDFANAKDDLGKFSEIMGVSANNINAFGNALRLEGGTLNSFMGQLAGIEKFRAGFKVGDIGFLPSAEKAGIDTRTILNAKDAGEAFLSLADQFQKLSKQQRINAAQAMGLDEASIRLLSKGREAVEKVINKQKQMRPVTQAMTKAAADFNDETQDLGTNIGGFADKISVKALPQINNLIAGTNDWLDSNRELINSGIDVFLDTIGDNILSIAAAIGLVATAGGLGAVGKITSMVGGKTGLPGATKAGGLASKAGRGAGALGLGILAFEGGQAIGREISENLSDDINEAIGGTIAHALARFGFSEAERAINRQDFTAVDRAKEDRSTQVNKTQLKAVTSQRQQPIVIQNTVNLDGQVIDRKVVKVVGEMADQAMQDLTSTEGG